MLDTVLIDQVVGSGYLECGYLVWQNSKDFEQTQLKSIEKWEKNDGMQV